MITVAYLIAAGIDPALAAAFEAPLQATAIAYGIDTPMREAAFVAQCAHESEGFTKLVESLWYTNPERLMQIYPREITSMDQATSLLRNSTALGNVVYANRGGNGNEASGDGGMYIGRGLIQITFRGTYMNCGLALDLDLLNHPELLELPENAAMSAGWFWDQNNINDAADTGSVAAVTKRINPALEGLADRERLYALATAAGATA